MEENGEAKANSMRGDKREKGREKERGKQDEVI